MFGMLIKVENIKTSAFDLSLTSRNYLKIKEDLIHVPGSEGH